MYQYIPITHVYEVEPIVNKDSFSYSIRTPWTNDKLNWFAIAVEP